MDAIQPIALQRKELKIQIRAVHRVQVLKMKKGHPPERMATDEPLQVLDSN